MSVLRNVGTRTRGIRLLSELTSASGVADTESTLITINDDAILKSWQNFGVPVHEVLGDGRTWWKVLSAAPASPAVGDIWLEQQVGGTVLRYQSTTGTVTLLSDVAGLQLVTANIILAGHAVRPDASGLLYAAAIVDGAHQYRCIGVNKVDTISGGSAEVLTTGDHLQLSDWSLLTGAATLTPNAYYYLSATPGRYTTTPAAAVTVRVGIAVSTDTLLIETGVVVLS